MRIYLSCVVCVAVSWVTSLGVFAQQPEDQQKPALKASQRWALLIGVNDYANLTKLEYCGRDMVDLREQLVASGFPDEQVFLMHDEAKENRYRPSFGNIERQLELVLGLVEPGDLVVVAFSGHGVYLDGKSFLCPNDASLEKAASTLVGLESVYEQLEQCQATLKVFLVDACRNDPNREGQRSARTVSENHKRFSQPLEQPPQGILLLTSCAPGEISMEEQEFGHGVFMHYVLEGLKGQADSDQSGRVSLVEMYQYANRRTKAYVVKRFNFSQRPGLKGNLDDDFDITAAVARNEPIVPMPEPAVPMPQPGVPTPQPANVDDRDKVITNSIGMKLALIPAGEFMMGSPIDEPGRYPVEGQHREQIAKPFYLGVYEVTQEEYQQVMGTNPSYFSSTGEGRGQVQGLDTSRSPVDNVSWEDAVEFCRRLSVKESREYRLPTEAEWEYACRAGSQTAYHFGDSLDRSQANFSPAEFGPERATTTTSVGKYPPNAYGLYDMYGNVYEWCDLAEDDKKRLSNPGEIPIGAPNRGGGFSYGPRTCRSAARRWGLMQSQDSCSGFRVCLTAVKPARE